MKINGVDFETIYKKMKPLIQYDDGCDGWLHHNMLDFLRSVKYMQMIDCAGDDFTEFAKNYLYIG